MAARRTGWEVPSEGKKGNRACGQNGGRVGRNVSCHFEAGRVRPGIVACTERGVSLTTEYSYSHKYPPNLQNEEMVQWMMVPRRLYVYLQLLFLNHKSNIGSLGK